MRLLALLGALGVLGATSCARVQTELATSARALRDEIYDAVDSGVRVPIELATPIVARSVIRSFLDDLDLPDEVRARIDARLDSEDFVDRTLPFVFWLAETYTARWSGEGFDLHAGEVFASVDDAPGLEHQLFAFPDKDAEDAEDAEGSGKPSDDDEPATSTGFGANRDVLRGLVLVYDVIFLQGAPHPFDVESDDSPETVERLVPIVRDVLGALARRLSEESELGPQLESLRADERATRALAASLIDLIRGFTHTSHERFARFAFRREQLRSWLLAELDREGGGRIPDFLEHADGRRHGVLVVVDGLQGHLVEALATDPTSSPFLTRVLEDERAAPLAPPEGVASRALTVRPHSFLEHLVTSGWSHPAYLPFFRRLYAEHSPGIARQGISTTPTISVRNVPTAQTGAPVAGPRSIGIPGFHFLDRAADRAYYFYGNDILQVGRLTRESGMSTLFGRLPHHRSLSANALYDRDAHFSLDYLANLAVGEKARDFGELLLLAELEKRLENELVARELRAELREVIALREGTPWYRLLARGTWSRRARQLVERIADLEDRCLPELLLWYDPWPDHFAHFTGPFADEILAPTGELNRLDYWLGRVEDVYRRAAILDRTLWAMAGDHGLACAHWSVSVEEAVFEPLAREGVALRVRKNSSDEGEGPKLVDPRSPPSMRGQDLVVASTAGGRYSVDAFLDQGEGWTRQPLDEDLRSLRTLDGDRVDIIEELRSRLGGALDYLVVRAGPCSLEGGTVRVVGTRNGERVEAVIERRGDRLRLEDPHDLLEVAADSAYGRPLVPAEAERRAALLARSRRADPDDDRTWLRSDEWAELTAPSPRPDSVVQLGHLYDTDLAGTINLFPAPGVGFNTGVPGRHAGETFHEKDAFAGVWGPPVRRVERLAWGRIGSPAATVGSWLSGRPALAGEDGWGYDAFPIDPGGVAPPPPRAARLEP